VFKIGIDGTGFAVLKEFSHADGHQPLGKLVLHAGVLYGTTWSGGSSTNGTVFRLNTNGTEFAVLKHFTSEINWTNSDGVAPNAELVLSGNTLYGTTQYGGKQAGGTVFKLNTDGTGFGVLRNFALDADGEVPQAGLVLGSSTLYGTTTRGGSANLGTVFGLTVLPEIQTRDGSFGVRTNRFGFNVTGITDQTVVVEACTNLAGPHWLPLQTNTLGAGPFYFSDPAWASFTDRFYRVRVE
jgi:uncharacterized repeat protein (TIGR03803 family)